MCESQQALFRGRHFRAEIIVLCLRWYLRYPLSYRDLEEMMAERGLAVDHSTIVDGHPAYVSAIAELKQEGELSRSSQCRPSPYLNNIIEQDHRFVKKRVVASQWFRSVNGALRSIAGHEAMNIIRKGQIRWLEKGDIVGQKRFIERTLGIAA